MSIIACVKVYDGLAIGAESMTQLFGASQQAGQPLQWVKAFSNAKKLFDVRQTPGVGVLTYGAGNIGSRSVGSYIDEFAGSITPVMTIQEIANGLRDHVQASYQAQFGQVPAGQQPATGFYVAGYSSNSHVGEELEFQFPQGDVVPPRPAGFGASWRGVPVPFARLYSGVDPRIYLLMQAQGVAPDIIARVQQEAANLVSPVAFDGMPVRDALGFCKFILETTIGVCTYELGVPSCGGPLQLAVITRREGFHWVLKPTYNV